MPMTEEAEPDPYFCYHTDPSEDLIANAEGLLVALGWISRSVHAWKWAVIAADMLATSALLIYLNDSSGTAALAPKSAKKWLELIQGKKFDPIPERRVLELPALLAKTRLAGEAGCPSPLPIEQVEADKIVALHSRLRNEFVHFKPGGLVVFVDELPELILSAISLAEMVISRVNHYWDPEERESHWGTTIALAKARLVAIAERTRAAELAIPDEEIAAQALPEC